MTLSPSCPTQLPSPIIFFDGVCSLCNRSISFFYSRDQQKQLHFAPLQGETAKKLLPDDLRKSEILSTLVYYKASSSPSAAPLLLIRSRAVAQILRDIGGVWRILGCALLIVPKPIADFGYRVIARYRHLITRTSHCIIPNADERKRILL